MDNLADHPRDDPRDDYLTVSQIASEIGVSEKPVRAAIERGELPAYNFGLRLTMVPREEFETWRESRRISLATKKQQQKGGLSHARL